MKFAAALALLVAVPAAAFAPSAKAPAASALSSMPPGPDMVRHILVVIEEIVYLSFLTSVSGTMTTS